MKFPCHQSGRTDRYLRRHYLKPSQKSPGEKRSTAEGDKIFEALDMAENLGVKVEAILKKLEKLYVIEHQLKEVHVKVANIEASVSKLDSEVQVLTTRTTKQETDVKELEQLRFPI